MARYLWKEEWMRVPGDSEGHIGKTDIPGATLQGQKAFGRVEWASVKEG